MKGDEIKGILRRKQVHFSSPLLYFAAEVNGLPFSRLAVICPGRLGTAVRRNRARRIAVAAFNRISRNIGKKANVVLTIRALGSSLSEIENTLAEGLRRVSL